MIAIIGAGISGLTLGYYLKKQGKQFTIFEKSHIGGVLRTKREEGRTFDLGPNSLILNKEAEELIEDLGLSSKLRYAHESSKDRFIIHRKELVQLPSKPQELLKSSLIGFGAKTRIARELLGLFKKSKEENETVQSFFKRHFGKEITEKLVHAFVNGIYSLNPDELDLELTFPKLVELETKYGSILKGLMKEKSLERMKSVNFEGGFQTLVTALRENLSNHIIESEVESLSKSAGGYTITFQDEFGPQSDKFNKVVFCSDLKSTEKLLKDLSLGIQPYFEATKVLSINTISLVYRKSAVQKPMNGFGALGTNKSAVGFSGVINVSQTFPTKLDNHDEVMLTVMIKGKQDEMNDDELIAFAHKELSQVLGITEFPVAQDVTRWENGLPQYNRELNVLNKELNKFRFESIYFNANWVGAISIKDCISKSKEKSTFL